MTVEHSLQIEQERVVARHLGDVSEPINERTVVERFASIVSQFPDHEAMRANESSCTYEQLEVASNRTAAAILAVGGDGPGPVALIAGMGISAVAGILGILKAGKFYVPLEPLFPIQRLRIQLDAMGDPVIVTNIECEELTRQLANSANRVINVDKLKRGTGNDETAVFVKPDDLVCVTHSSGSTGKPKGVMQTNRNIMHMVFGQNGPARWRNLRFAQHASFIYTGSIFEIFGALLSGSTLCPYDIRTDGFDGLARQLKEFKINCCGFAPTVFRTLCTTLGPDEQFPDVRRLVLGGAAISVSDVELYKQHFPRDTLLVTGLSSSETGSVSIYNIDHEVSITRDPVPVGYARPGYRISILDTSGAEVAPGKTGEIAVTSSYLSPGYWQNVEATRKKFSPLEATEEPRTYYSGDRGWMAHDGCLTYVGRADNLVKVNAQMIDLDDLEAALTEIDALDQAAVVVDRGRMGGERLIAHVVVKPGSSPSVRSLRSALSDRLPFFMIPAAFVFRDKLPLTDNNKIDRQKLSQQGS